MAVLLANVGNRNFKYGQAFISKDIEKNDNFFEQTKLIYEDFENEVCNIQLNILDVLISEYQPKIVYLFVTNQPKPFRQDTYYAGLIIQKLLGQKNIQTYLVEFHNDPRDRDATFSFFENFFMTNPQFRDDQIIVSGSGGVPAMKEALNFYAVATLQSPKIVDVDENTQTIMQSNIAQSYLKKFQEETLFSFFDHHNYSWAYLYLKSPACLISTVVLERKLMYLEAKYNFDFAKANRYIDEHQPGFELLQMINPSATLDKYLYQKKQNLIYLLDNLEITYKKWEYTSLLGKLYAFKENFARWRVEEIIQSKSENLNQIEADRIIATYSQYFDLEKPKVPQRKNNAWEQRKYYLNINDITIPDTVFQSLLEKLKSLHWLRNTSIMAHGFMGIGKEGLDQVQILDLIKELRWKTLGQKKNKFDEAECVLKSMIAKI